VFNTQIRTEVTTSTVDYGRASDWWCQQSHYFQRRCGMWNFINE